MALVMKRLVTSSLKTSMRGGVTTRGKVDLRSVRKEMQPTSEAMQMASDLKRAKPSDVDAMVEARCKRMVRFDYITVLQTLQRDGDVDLCLKVFEMMRKERWYKPSSQLYGLVMDLVFKRKRMDDWKRLVNELEEENGEALLEMFTLPFKEYVIQGDFDGCMEFYETVQHVICKKLMPEFYLFCVKKLREAEQPALVERVVKDLSLVQEYDC